jgi:hypothetical protein
MTTKTGRFEMRMDRSFLDQIEELAREMKLSKAEVLRQSIGLYAQVLAQAKQGKMIQFRDEEVAEEIEVIPSGNTNFIPQSSIKHKADNHVYA